MDIFCITITVTITIRRSLRNCVNIMEKNLELNSGLQGFIISMDPKYVIYIYQIIYFKCIEIYIHM